MSQRRPRILIYSHDTYGLGHLRRSLLIASRLVASDSPSAVLIATGSARAHSFECPRGVDTFKLPSIVKAADGSYVPRSLNLPLKEVLRIRSELLVEAVRSFVPDVILVDHAPAGLEGELRPLFRMLSDWASKPKMMLGLRDIIDHPDRVRAEWDRLAIWPILDEVYDHIMVYGDSRVLTTAQELNLEERFGGKLTFTGYLGRKRRSNESVHSKQHPKRVLVTTGGGGDGQGLLRAYAAFLEQSSKPTPFVSTIVTGPFLSERRQQEIEERLNNCGQPIEILNFTDHMEDLVESASAAICMTGYNTAVEVLSAGVPSLFVPRETPRLEQTIRAERLSRMANLDWCPTEACTPARIRQFIERALAEACPRSQCPIDIRGLDQVAQCVDQILDRDRAAKVMPLRIATPA